MPAIRVFRTLGSASFLFALAAATAGAPGCTADADLEARRGLAVDDLNPCTADKRVNGITTHDSAPKEGLACTRGGNAGTCKTGECIPNCVTDSAIPCVCAIDADCPNSTDCSTWSCDAGTCKNTLVAQGTEIADLKSGDCQKQVCDGQGGMKNEANDADVEPSNNPCVTNTCSAGMPATPSYKAVGTSCGSQMVCNGQGVCASCLSAADMMKCSPNCAVKLCQGEMCTDKAECGSGFCADGVCCNDGCTGECMSCGVVGSVGMCTKLPYYDEDHSYVDPVFMVPTACTVATGSVCNGSGKCLKTIGKTCALDGECIGGTCAMPAKVCLGAKGESCTGNVQCVSMTCNAMAQCN